MAKTDATVMTVERGACRVLRLVKNGSSDGWTTALRRTHAVRAEPPGPAEPGVVGSDVGDPGREAVEQAAADVGRSAVLGLPSSRLLVKILRLPVAVREDLQSAVALQMAKYAPFSGDDMTVSSEVLAETEQDLTVFAAALPHAAVAALDPWLQASRLRINRVDALMLGWWRQAQQAVAPAVPAVRRIFLACVADEWDLLVADGSRPVLARGLGTVSDPQAFALELTLSLLSAEAEAAAVPLHEVIFFTGEPPDALIREAIRQALAVPVRHVRPQQEDADVYGLAVRDAEEAPTFNLLPDLWRARNAAGANKKQFWTAAIGLAALWLVLAGALFGTPAVVKQRVAGVKQALAANEEPFQAVQNVRTRAELIESYQDRSLSLLEVMRVVAELMPSGVDLTSLTYRREEGVRMAGEALQPELVYQFKDAIENTGPFGACTLAGISLSGDRRKHRFEMQAALKTAEGGQ